MSVLFMDGLRDDRVDMEQVGDQVPNTIVG